MFLANQKRKTKWKTRQEKRFFLNYVLKITFTFTLQVKICFVKKDTKYTANTKCSLTTSTKQSLSRCFFSFPTIFTNYDNVLRIKNYIEVMKRLRLWESSNKVCRVRRSGRFHLEDFSGLDWLQVLIFSVFATVFLSAALCWRFGGSIVSTPLS